MKRDYQELIPQEIAFCAPEPVPAGVSRCFARRFTAAERRANEAHPLSRLAGPLLLFYPYVSGERPASAVLDLKVTVTAGSHRSMLVTDFERDSAPQTCESERLVQ